MLISRQRPRLIDGALIKGNVLDTLHQPRTFDASTRTRMLGRATLLSAVLVAGAFADGGALVDPTAPQSRAATTLVVDAPAKQYRLSGVWRRNGRTLVVINGATVGLGADVDGAKVVAVSDNQVRLRTRDGGELILHTSPQVVHRGALATKVSQRGDETELATRR